MLQEHIDNGDPFDRYDNSPAESDAYFTEDVYEGRAKDNWTETRKNDSSQNTLADYEVIRENIDEFLKTVGLGFDMISDKSYNGTAPSAIVDAVRGLVEDGTETYFRNKNGEANRAQKAKASSEKQGWEKTAPSTGFKSTGNKIADTTTQTGGISLPENRASKRSASRENNKNLPLDQRVRGDELLDAQDLIGEVKSNDGQVDKNGYITLYHRTSPQNAESIRKTGVMKAAEDGLFFSTREDGEYNDGYGKDVVKFKIPAERLVIDDVFGDEAHLRLPLGKSRTMDVSEWLVGDEGQGHYVPVGENRASRRSSMENPMDQREYDEDINGIKVKGKGEHVSVTFGDGEYSTADMRKLYSMLDPATDADTVEIAEKVFAFCEEHSIRFKGNIGENNPDEVNRANGYYQGDLVRLNDIRGFNLENVPSSQKAKTILHDPLHAATVYALDLYSRQTTYFLTSEQIEACKQLNEIYDQLKNDRSVKGYGMKKQLMRNPHV